MQKYILSTLLLMPEMIATALAEVPVITVQPRNVKSIVHGSAEFSVVAGNLLTNGGFEHDTPSSLGAVIPGWTNIGVNYAVQGAAQNVIARERSKALTFNPANTAPNATIGQVFTTTPGKIYRVSFWHGGLGQPTGQLLTVRISNADDARLLFSTSYSISGSQSTSVMWAHREFFFLASGTSTTLAIEDDTTHNGYDEDQVIDDVQASPLEAALTYQWYQAPATLLAGQTSSTLRIPDVTAAAAYYCKITDASTGATTTSKTATLTLLPLLSVDSGEDGNRRYFRDGLGNSVYLTGHHTPITLNDWGSNALDWTQYTQICAEKNFNFIRMWQLENPYPKDLDHQNAPVSPLPWNRTGPGTAADGQPKFDLDSPNPAFYERLSARVKEAGSRGIYVSYMFTCPIFAVVDVSPSNFTYSAYNPANNINFGLTGLTSQDTWVYGYDAWNPGTTYFKGQMVKEGATLYVSAQDSNINSRPSINPSIWTNVGPASTPNAALNAMLDDYIDRVVDTLNQYDNVLYEVGNEGPLWTNTWAEHVITRVKAREAGMPKQHPVGKTAFGTNNISTATNATQNDILLASAADWVSLSGRGGPDEGNPTMANQLYLGNVPVSPSHKVSILDTDHIVGYSTAAQSSILQQWVWKSLTRGHNPIYINPGFGWPGNTFGTRWLDGGDIAVENRLGWARALADRCHLRSMSPDEAVSDTTFALRNRNDTEYLIYQPNNASFRVTLPSRRFHEEWIDPNSGKTIAKSEFTTAAGIREFVLPSGYDNALLHLERLHVTSAQHTTTGPFVFSGAAIPGVKYEVEVSPDLTRPFASVTSVTASPLGAFTVQDPVAAAAPRKFYRLLKSDD